MSDLTERLNYLLGRSDMTPGEAARFIADIIDIGIKASAFRDDVHRAKRQAGGLYVVATDEGSKSGD